jgi:hypothetical protein
MEMLGPAPAGQEREYAFRVFSCPTAWHSMGQHGGVFMRWTCAFRTSSTGKEVRFQGRWLQPSSMAQHGRVFFWGFRAAFAAHQQL